MSLSWRFLRRWPTIVSKGSIDWPVLLWSLNQDSPCDCSINQIWSIGRQSEGWMWRKSGDKRRCLELCKKECIWSPEKCYAFTCCHCTNTSWVALYCSYCNSSNKGLLDKGEGCELLTEKTYASIKDETLATIFAMAQQNSMKLACQLTFEQTLCVYFMKLLG